jgi:hypothetical protein
MKAPLLGSFLRFPGNGAGLAVGPDLALDRGRGLPRGVEQPATGARNAPVASLTTGEKLGHLTNGCRPVYHFQIPSH